MTKILSQTTMQTTGIMSKAAPKLDAPVLLVAESALTHTSSQDVHQVSLVKHTFELPPHPEGFKPTDWIWLYANDPKNLIGPTYYPRSQAIMAHIRNQFAELPPKQEILERLDRRFWGKISETGSVDSIGANQKFILDMAHEVEVMGWKPIGFFAEFDPRTASFLCSYPSLWPECLDEYSTAFQTSDPTGAVNNPNFSALVSEVGQRVLDGSHVLYFSPNARLTFPTILALSHGSEHSGPTIDYRVVTESDPLGEKLYPTTWRSVDNVRRKLTEDTLLEILRERIAEIKAEGKTPLIPVDMDGTAVFTRAYTWNVILDFMRSYDGEDADEMRKRVRGRESALFFEWNTTEALEKLGFKYDAHNPSTIHKAADKHYQATFFDALNMLEAPPSKRVIQILEELFEDEDVHFLILTTRSEAKDRIPQHSNSFGETSGVRAWLKKNGLWRDGRWLIKRAQKDTNWKGAAYRQKGFKEPSKSEMLEEVLEHHQHLVIAASFENDPDFANTLQRFGIVVRPELDQKPGSPALKYNMFTVNPLLGRTIRVPLIDEGEFEEVSF